MVLISFVDGHSHTKIDTGLDVNATKIVSTGNYLNAVGVVVYDGKTTTAKLVDDSKQMYNIGGGPSDGMKKDVATFADIVNEAYAGKFATTLYTLDGSRAPGVRTQETNLGDFAADAYKYTAESLRSR